MRIAILGAGAFGTALAIALGHAGRSVVLWARNPGDMGERRENTRHLPGFRLPDKVRVTGDMDEAAEAPTVLLAVPMQALCGFLEQHGQQLDGHALVATCKGIDLATGLMAHEVIARACPQAQAALISGPSFATDLAAGLPTALTLAARDGSALQHQLSTPTMRLYLSDDLTGVALGGALKNVIAIAAGLTIGAGLGESARAALIARGFAEMTRFATAKGARPETLAGLSGLGDLVLTATSEKSRNFALGVALGRGRAQPAGVTIEGVATARAVRDAARQMGLDMPITGMVVAVTEGRLSAEAARDLLLARPLKGE